MSEHETGIPERVSTRPPTPRPQYRRLVVADLDSSDEANTRPLSPHPESESSQSSDTESSDSDDHFDIQNYILFGHLALTPGRGGATLLDYVLAVEMHSGYLQWRRFAVRQQLESSVRRNLYRQTRRNVAVPLWFMYQRARGGFGAGRGFGFRWFCRVCVGLALPCGLLAAVVLVVGLGGRGAVER